MWGGSRIFANMFFLPPSPCRVSGALLGWRLLPAGRRLIAPCVSRSRWGGWSQVCLAGQPGGRGLLRRAALPARRDAATAIGNVCKHFMGHGRFKAGKHRACYRPVICPGARQALYSPCQYNQEFTKINNFQCVLCVFPRSAVCRISMHAHTYRQIIESYRIYTAMIYASIFPSCVSISSIF